MYTYSARAIVDVYLNIGNAVISKIFLVMCEKSEGINPIFVDPLTATNEIPRSLCCSIV